ncbi:MotA/TolQ/ExbB proton channel family protein [Pseudoalteromonas sp. BMB]|uniref:MotA/TolQ/ExbB proton channel family protein n=1 Tax=Pseudoalteromonas sp. BMB TaxID=1874619 RepID=UPI000AD2D39A|nr:MotA/TolQ/ExbB proton channel family protein [Pseudoalteromonas sp. BMB]
MNNTRLQSMNPSKIVFYAALLGIFTLIHLLYQGIVRPTAEAAIALQGAGATTNIWVILKDFEQQICLSLGIFCLFLIAYKSFRILNEEIVYTFNHLHNLRDDDGQDLDKMLAELQQSKYKDNEGLQTWINCILRYKNTGNVQHASDAIKATVEGLSAQLEAGNNMIRYCIWAIPSIGFVGTVRGIGMALAKAEEAVAGDISGMVDKLGVAFNSTLVSLLISLVLMFFLHLLNNQQDLLVIKTQKSCENNLLTHLHK